jgi:hypothetical protein
LSSISLSLKSCFQRFHEGNLYLNEVEGAIVDKIPGGGDRSHRRRDEQDFLDKLFEPMLVEEIDSNAFGKEVKTWTKSAQLIFVVEM